MATPETPSIPIWALLLLIVPALIGFGGLITTVVGMSKPKPARNNYFAIGAGLTVLGAVLFLVILGILA
jgi:hypothetical protein